MGRNCFRSVSAISLGALLSLWVPTAHAAAANEGPWEIAASGSVGIPSGWVKVGENQVAGTRLHFRGDLGIDTSGSAELRVGYHLDSLQTLRLSLQTIFLDGTTTLSRDVFFNGTTLERGTRLETQTDFPDFFRATITYERSLLPLGEHGMLYGSAGLTYVLLTFRVKGTLAPTSRGHETKEDFLTQELPVPIIGTRANYPIAEHLDGVFAVSGGYLPRVDSLRSEGGDVKLNQAHVDLDLALAYAFSANLSLEGGYRYTYFFQLEKSREDDNVILLSDNALRLSLVYAF